MNIPARTPALLLIAFACAATGCSREKQPGRARQATSETSAAIPGSNSTAAPATRAPDHSAAVAVEAFVDPATGEMRAPTESELAALQKTRTQTAASIASSSTSSANVIHLPNGMTQYELGARGNVEDTACIQPDGSLGECSNVQRKALRNNIRQP